MKRGTLLFLLMILPTAAQAQQAVIGAQDVLRGHFTETRVMEGFNGPMTLSGQFVVAPARGLIWEVQKPFPTTTIMTPAGLAQIVNGAVISHLPAQKIPFLLHLYNMLGGALAGNWKPLESEFAITRNNKDDAWQVVLVPLQNNSAMPFHRITVSGHQFVETVMLVKEGGDSDELKFGAQFLSQKPLSAPEIVLFKSVQP